MAIGWGIPVENTKKIEVDCTGCDTEKCCTLVAEPMMTPLMCLYCVEGRCLIEDQKNNACKLYPVVVVQTCVGIVLCVDRRCPQYKTITFKQAAEVAGYYAKTGDLIIFDEFEVNYLGFDLVPLEDVEQCPTSEI